MYKWRNAAIYIYIYIYIYISLSCVILRRRSNCYLQQLNDLFLSLFLSLHFSLSLFTPYFDSIGVLPSHTLILSLISFISLFSQSSFFPQPFSYQQYPPFSLPCRSELDLKRFKSHLRCFQSWFVTIASGQFMTSFRLFDFKILSINLLLNDVFEAEISSSKSQHL